MIEPASDEALVKRHRKPHAIVRPRTRRNQVRSLPLDAFPLAAAGVVRVKPFLTLPFQPRPNAGRSGWRLPTELLFWLSGAAVLAAISDDSTQAKGLLLIAAAEPLVIG